MGVAVRCLAATYYGGYHIAPHSHPRGQLIHAASGMMRVRAGDTLWVVPPARAIWAPAGAEHAIDGIGNFAMRALYFLPELVTALPQQCCAIEVSPLLREVVLELIERCPVDEADRSATRLVELAIECIGRADTPPLSLPLPRDPRALRVADLLREEPGLDADLAALAARAGGSTRTIQRLFLAETGLPFAQWRQRLRLLHGAGLVAGGMAVTEAALEAGYAGTSAFSAAFRRHFGVPPSRLG